MCLYKSRYHKNYVGQLLDKIQTHFTKKFLVNEYNMNNT